MTDGNNTFNFFKNYWWHDLSWNLQKEGKKANPKLQKTSPLSQRSIKILGIEKISKFAPSHRKVNDMIKEEGHDYYL